MRHLLAVLVILALLIFPALMTAAPAQAADCYPVRVSCHITRASGSDTFCGLIPVTPKRLDSGRCVPERDDICSYMPDCNAAFPQCCTDGMCYPASVTGRCREGSY